MASTILLKRSNTAGNDTYTGPLGEVTIDTQARKLRIHDGTKTGGHVVANMADVQAVVSQVDGLTTADIAGLDTALASITDRLDTLETDVSDLQTTYVNKDGSVAFTGNVDAGGNRVTNVAAPQNANDAANKNYVDSEIAAIGSAFSYEGGADGGGTTGTATDITSLSGQTDAGSYYRVTTSGYFTDGTTTEYANVDDAIIFNTTGGFEIIDNTNSQITGTANYVDVSGSADTGYTIDVDQDFKDRVTTVENTLPNKVNDTNSAMTGDATVSGGTLEISSLVPIGSGSSTTNVFSVVDSEAAPLFSVKENGDTVIGGVLTVNGSGTSTFAGDVEIGGAISVANDATLNADFTADDLTLTGNLSVHGNSNLGNDSGDVTTITGTALAPTVATNDSSNKVSTTQYVRNFVEGGTYTIDGGTF